MSQFLKEWLQKNKRDNEKTLKNLKEVSNSTVPTPSSTEAIRDPIPSTSRAVVSDPIPSTSRGVVSDPIPSKSNQTDPDLMRENEIRAQNATKPTDLVFENDSLKLTVIKGTHRQESKFKLLDHMFYLTVVPKKSKKMPLLAEILNFLYIAFNFILNELKKFYNPRDRNIAFITLTQASMLNGLNTGEIIFSFSCKVARERES